MFNYIREMAGAEKGKCNKRREDEHSQTLSMKFNAAIQGRVAIHSFKSAGKTRHFGHKTPGIIALAYRPHCSQLIWSCNSVT